MEYDELIEFTSESIKNMSNIELDTLYRKINVRTSNDIESNRKKKLLVLEMRSRNMDIPQETVLKFDCVMKNIFGLDVSNVIKMYQEQDKS